MIRLRCGKSAGLKSVGLRTQNRDKDNEWW